jgi:hypothetical protein
MRKKKNEKMSSLIPAHHFWLFPHVYCPLFEVRWTNFFSGKSRHFYLLLRRTLGMYNWTGKCASKNNVSASLKFQNSFFTSPLIDDANYDPLWAPAEWRLGYPAVQGVSCGESDIGDVGLEIDWQKQLRCHLTNF